MIRLLTDENIPPVIVKYLRDKGFDVKDIHELDLHGASDSVTLDLARQEKRTLITFDKHFANILLYPLHTHNGIIRIRIHPPLIKDIIESFEKFLIKLDISEMKRSLIIMEKDEFRVRRETRQEPTE